ncbi:MAG: hypothetical protein R6W90_12885 [Ignavibacteriaceae bacterium]
MNKLQIKNYRTKKLKGGLMGLTTGGILFMVIAWSIIATLIVFCFSKVFKSGRKNFKGK